MVGEDEGERWGAGLLVHPAHCPPRWKKPPCCTLVQPVLAPQKQFFAIWAWLRGAAPSVSAGRHALSHYLRNHLSYICPPGADPATIDAVMGGGGDGNDWWWWGCEGWWWWW